ncbi:cysteine desulfurase family protein [Ruminococcus albus]|uniref:Cysteine desulfurase n=1 Tax=Ruminococcus albus TaxID=1264 RepID=A0A1I1JLZ4_RUMAL|nr:cysteine desulfurase family protein [Ruminococcus albus]SFC47608.1 cysteine desulfurase [Ruminococcus albus]
MSNIYLDYSADTPADERVLSVYTETARNAFANPNSLHSEGRKARSAVDDSLVKISELLGVSTDELIFTSGASEANNLAIKGIAHSRRRKGKHIVSTFLEHSSVSGALTYLQEQGWEIDLVNILPSGKIDLEHLKSLMRDDTVLCAVCAVDSELGTVQPISEISEIVKGYPNCVLHVDATQAIGKIKLDLTGVHTASFAPHKFYGLKGFGVLYKAKSIILEPLIHGGASTTIYRSGTPDAPAASACAAALKYAFNEIEERNSRVSELNQKLRDHFLENNMISINSPEDAVPHILNISVNGIKGEEMRRLLDEQGVCVSVKSACSVANTPSRSVMALFHDRKRALSSWRISLSHLTSDAELEKFIEILGSIIQR